MQIGETLEAQVRSTSSSSEITTQKGKTAMRQEIARNDKFDSPGWLQCEFLPSRTIEFLENRRF